MRTVTAIALLTAIICCTGACRQNPSDVDAPAAAVSSVFHSSASVERPESWDEYWYGGLAELNVYRTTQRRYGEDREGQTVLVFVTEPFLAIKQVKDDGLAMSEESVSVMKLNRLERFSTGVYDYAIMQSVFTPVSRDRYPNTLKTTLSVQDWCGQVWAQYNLREGDYQVEYRSYFQSESDQQFSYNAVLLEDELPNLVRLNPERLPTGRVSLIPSEKYGRLHHKSTEPRRATFSFSESEAGRVLVVDYANLDRVIRYIYEADFPHRLERWTVMQDGVVDFDAVRTATLREPYWQQNGTRFAPMRDSLGLQ